MSTVIITLTDTPQGFSVRSHFDRLVSRDSVLTPAEAEALRLTREALKTAEALLVTSHCREQVTS